MTIIFISSKDSEESRSMHTKIDKIEIMTGNETDKVIEELCHYFSQR